MTAGRIGAVPAAGHQPEDMMLLGSSSERHVHVSGQEDEHHAGTVHMMIFATFLMLALTP